MPPRPGGVCDRPSPGELASMMNGHLSALYRPTKSCAYHAFMTNFCCFVLLSPIFWMKLQREEASCFFSYCSVHHINLWRFIIAAVFNFWDRALLMKLTETNVSDLVWPEELFYRKCSYWESKYFQNISFWCSVYNPYLLLAAVFFCGLGENTDLYITLSLFMYLLQAAFSVDSPGQLMMPLHMCWD